MKRIAKIALGTIVIAGLIYAAARYIPWWLAGPTHAASTPTQVYSIAFSADGNRLVSGHHCCTGPDNRFVENEMVRVWDATGRQQAALSGHNAGVLSVHFTHDGKRIVSSQIDGGRIRVWDAASGKMERTINDVDDYGTWSIAISPDSTQLATSNGGNFDLATGQLVSKLASPCVAGTGQVAFSPDGKQVAVASPFDAVTICDAQTGELIRKLGRAGRMGLYVTFLPDGKRVLAHGWFRKDGPADISEPRPPLLWDVETGRALSISDFQSPERIAVSADGRWLASVRSMTVDVYELATGRLAHTGRLWRNSRANSLAITPDGKWIAVGGPEAIEIWHLQ